MRRLSAVTHLAAASSETYEEVEAAPYAVWQALTRDVPFAAGDVNKLASNIALGRDTAGVHWRSDAIAGMKLGEAVAIGILRDVRSTYHEDFQGFSRTTFDGTTITI